MKPGIPEAADAPPLSFPQLKARGVEGILVHSGGGDGPVSKVILRTEFGSRNPHLKS